METSAWYGLLKGFIVAESPRLTIHYCSPRDNRPFWCYFNETYASEFV